jgi:hypothetical protein
MERLKKAEWTLRDVEIDALDPTVKRRGRCADGRGERRSIASHPQP